MADDPEIDGEIDEHLELLTQRYISQGMTEDAARRAARLQFGNLTLHREDRYRLQTIPVLESLWQDLRHAARTCRRNPGFTAAVALTLALGIGANTAIFTICNAILLRPLPYHDPDRLVMLWERQRTGDAGSVAPANFLDWRAQTHSFDRVTAIHPFPNFVLSGAGDAQRLTGAAVSWDFFSLLGIEMSMGRSFLPEEDRPDANRVVILPYSTWETRFGARRDILGSGITLNDVRYTVVGVLPRDFEFVNTAKDFQAGTAFDLWVPVAINTQKASRGSHPLRVFARLKPNVTLEQAQADLDVVAANLARAYPEDNKDKGILAVPLFQQVTARPRPALLTLLGAVGFVLLIACGNIANLLLSRGAARQRELSVRLAIGAGLHRLAQQLLVESLFLATIGGALGLLVAIVAMQVAGPYLPADVSRATTVGIDPRVLLFTTVVSLTTGLLFGLAPLIQARRVNPADALTAGTRVATGLPMRLRSSLLFGQVAVTVVLSIGAGLMARSLWTLLHVPTGFNADHVLTARVTLPPSRYPDQARVAALHRDVLDRTRATNGVRAAGLTAYLPLTGADNAWSFYIEGRPPLPIGVYEFAKYRPVSDGYFEALGMPVVRGRSFNPSDSKISGDPIVVINEFMARKYWGTEDPIGKRLRFGGKTWRTIVGVVGDVRHGSLDDEVQPEMYVLFAQAPTPEGLATLVVRTAGDAAAITTAVRRIVGDVDASLPIDRIRTMDQVVSSSVGTPRFQTIVFAALALLALTMASIGIYGVTSYTVTQRTREFGIRVALGASRGTILRRVFAQSGAVIGAGLCAGLLAAVGLTRLITGLLYGVTPLDSVTFVTVPLFLFGVACLATYLPARRATRVNPIVALRVE